MNCDNYWFKWNELRQLLIQMEWIATITDSNGMNCDNYWFKCVCSFLIMFRLFRYTRYINGCHRTFIAVSAILNLLHQPLSRLEYKAWATAVRVAPSGKTIILVNKRSVNCSRDNAVGVRWECFATDQIAPLLLTREADERHINSHCSWWMNVMDEGGEWNNACGCIHGKEVQAVYFTEDDDWYQRPKPKWLVSERTEAEMTGIRTDRSPIWQRSALVV